MLFLATIVVPVWLARRAKRQNAQQGFEVVQKD
jgi:hypothetical protein